MVSRFIDGRGGAMASYSLLRRQPDAKVLPRGCLPLRQSISDSQGSAI